MPYTFPSGGSGGGINLAGSNTTYTSGTVVLTGVGGGITVSSNAGQRIDLSVAAQTVQVVQSAIAASNTTYTSGQVEFTGSNMITVKSSANQRVVIDATQSVQTQNAVDVSIGGNSTSQGAGYILISSGTMRLAGGPNITLSQDGQTVSISGGAGAGGGVMIAASNTTFTSGTVVMSASGGAITINSGVQSVGFSVPQTSSLSASANITISTNGSTISFSVAQQTGISSIQGSDATYTSGKVIFTGVGGGITVSSNTGQRIDLSVASNKSFNMHAWQNMPPGIAGPGIYATGFSKVPFYWPEVLPGQVTLNSIGFLASVVTTGTLQSFTIHFGVYTYANSTSANLLGSAAESYVLSTGTSASFSGARIWVLTSPGTVAAISALTPGAYLFGSMISAGATASMNLSFYGVQHTEPGIIMPGTNNPSTGISQGVLMLGRGTSTVNAMPAAVSRADLNNQTTGVSAPITPYMMIRS